MSNLVCNSSAKLDTLFYDEEIFDHPNVQDFFSKYLNQLLPPTSSTTSCIKVITCKAPKEQTTKLRLQNFEKLSNTNCILLKNQRLEGKTL